MRKERSDMARSAYQVKGELWLYPGESANWHFVSVPKKESEAIVKAHPRKKAGFGSIRVSAKIGKTSWETSIFPDKRSGTYLLPVKAEVRRKEHLSKGDIIAFLVEIR